MNPIKQFFHDLLHPSKERMQQALSDIGMSESPRDMSFLLKELEDDSENPTKNEHS